MWKSIIGRRLISSISKPISVEIETGVKLHGHTAGDGKHHILCIPGALGTGLTDYKPQLEYFGRVGSGFTITSFDPMGYGKSRGETKRKFTTSPTHFLKQDAIDAYQGMMNEMAVDKFSVLGWSDGGIAGMFLAGCFPHAVNKLVMWGSNSYLSEDDIKLFESIRDVNKWSKRMRESLESIYSNELSSLWSEWVDSMIEVYDNQNGDICEGILVSIVCPTLIFHGDKDPLVPPFHPVHLHNNIKGSVLHRFPEGKHNIHLKYSHEFNSIVEKFLLN